MLQAHLDHIFSTDVKRVVVGYSGGLDSHVLLHQLWKATQSKPGSPPVCALHVNHGLSANSNQWQQHCEFVCKTMGIDCYSFAVKVDPKGSLEENARTARYQLFDTFLKASDLLLLAHHQDDQIETALFKLIRGLGFKGMPLTRKLKDSRLYRPLLDTSREAIESYARNHGLDWIEDESNQDMAFDRNFIRLKLLPMIRDRWLHLNANLIHVLEREAETASLLNLYGKQDLLKAGAGNKVISLQVFRELELPRQRNLLRYWIQQYGFPFPSDGFVADAARQMVASDSFGLQWQAFEIRGYRGKAYLMKSSDGPVADVSYTLQAFIDQYPGVISVQQVKGEGLKAIYKDRLMIRFRQGGEKIDLKDGPGSKKLKKLFQEKGIPPWVRGKVPLIYKNEEAVAVPAVPEWNMDAVIVKEMQAGNKEAGLIVSWRLG